MNLKRSLASVAAVQHHSRIHRGLLLQRLVLPYASPGTIRLFIAWKTTAPTQLPHQRVSTVGIRHDSRYSSSRV